MQVGLESPLPAELATGKGTALFVAGTCFAPGEALESLVLLVDGEEQPLGAFGMPRLETLRANEPDGYRSGFWGMARIRLRAGDDRRCARASAAAWWRRRRWATIAAAPHGGARPRRRRRVAICMATYDPPLDLLRRQLDSIRAQTHANWVCVISDDCSRPERFAAICGGGRRRSALRAVARAAAARLLPQLRARAVAGAGRARDYVALADQDDAWHPDKLATLLARARRRAARLQRRADRRRGRRACVADTYWGTRRNNHTDLSSLLVANSVTGAASLFPRALLDDALPFPPGPVRALPRPLARARRAGARATSRSSTGRSTTTSSTATRRSATPPPTACRACATGSAGCAATRASAIRLWRMHYFVDACRLLQFATVLRLRCGDRMAPAKRRALERFERADRSLPALGAAGAARRAGAGRAGRETLGAEWMLAYALRLAPAARRHRAATARARAAPRRAAARRPRPRARAPRARPSAAPRVIGREDRAARAGRSRDDAPRGSTC